MKKASSLSLLAISVLLLSSCVNANEIETTGIINAIGIDQFEGNQIETTMIFFQFTEQAEKLTKLISGTGTTVQGSIVNAEKSALYKFVPGKMKIAVFGREVAVDGIFPLLDKLARDATVPDLMYLAMAEENAKTIFETDESNISTDIGQFLYSVLERHTLDHNIPRTTLQDFLRIYYDIGHDNVLPIFEMHEGIPKQTKNALFRGDQLVGELSNDEITLINLMDLVVREHEMEITLPSQLFEKLIEKKPKKKLANNDIQLSVTISKGKSKIKMIDIHTPSFVTKTKIKLRITEQLDNLALKEPEMIKQLEKALEEKIETDFKNLLDKTKKLNSDPIGFGRYYKAWRAGNDLTTEEWYEIYPNIQVNFDIHVTITQQGSID